MARTYTISVFTQNTPGVLHRITVLFTRRKVNIESLTVSETEQHGISRFTIVVKTTRDSVEKIAKQINRIIEVVDVFVAENRDLVFKEIAFFRVQTKGPQHRSEVEEHAHRYGATVVSAHDDYLILEKTGSEDDINSLYLLLEPFGLREFLRSGRIAMLTRERNGDGIFLEE